MYSAAQTSFLAVTIAHLRCVFNCVYEAGLIGNGLVGPASCVISISKSVRIIVEIRQAPSRSQALALRRKWACVVSGKPGAEGLPTLSVFCAFGSALGCFQQILGLAFLARHW